MNASEVKVGQRYRCSVSGKLVDVLITDSCEQGGWNALNLSTKRKLRIKSAARLKGLASQPKAEKGKVAKMPSRPSPRKLTDSDVIRHVVVLALAGCGKTFTLIVGVAYVFLFSDKRMWSKVIENLGFDPIPSDEQMKVWEQLGLSKSVQSIIYCAFNKSIVTQFGDDYGWLQEMLRKIGVNFQFATVNALGYAAVTRSFGRFGYKGCTDWHTRNLISAVTGRDLQELHKHDTVLVTATNELVGLVKLTLTGWTEGEKFDPLAITDKELDDLVSHFGTDLNGNRNKVYDLTREVLVESLDIGKYREMDFNDQNWLPVVLGLPVDKVDLLLVDEGQDLPRSKQEFCRMLGRRVVLVGDINQAIYGFAGADVDSIPRMQKLLGTDGAAVEPLYLTETRRCGKAIVEQANKTLQRCYRHRKEEPIEFRAHESNPDGLIRRTSIEKYTELLQDGDMVLCRVNAPLVCQALRRIKEGKKAIIRGRKFGEQLVKFVNDQKASDVGDLVAKVSDWAQKEAEKENRKRNPSENKMMMIADKKECVDAFCEDAVTVEEVISKLNLVFAGKVCPKCGKAFDEELEYCPIKSCKSERDPVTGYPRGPKLVVPEGVVYSSVHRAKGLEADNVFIILRDAPMPHPMAKSRWQVGQEWHCLYIAESRAIHTLTYVD